MQGVLGAFHEIDSAVHAVEELKQSKLGEVTVFTPTPRHEFEDAIGHEPSKVRVFALLFGLAGASFGYWIALWISDYWPIIVGGKAVVTWVPFTIPAFELMVLIGGLATVFSMFALSHIPRVVPTVGYDPRFSSGHFGVWVATSPDRIEEAAAVLTRNGAEEVRRER